MSRHWKPEIPEDWSAPSRGQAAARGFGLMLAAGIVLGLTIATGSALWSEPDEEIDLTSIPVPDHWAESKRSKELLEAQEGPAAGPAPARPAEVAPPKVTAAVAIIDGDTFRVAGETIRIADIDTPEVRGRCLYETELAARATQRMRALLLAGPFELESIARDEDRYGRKLRVVTRGGRSLGDQLVAEGLARTWTGRREPWCG
jgi:micrococcal nuclease